MKTSILFDGIIYGTQRAGGISVYYREMMRYLSKSEFDVCIDLPLNAQESLVLEKFLTDVPVSVELYRPRYLERLRKHKIVRGRRPDVVHSTYYRTPAFYDGPVVTTLHDFTSELVLKGPKAKAHALQKRACLARADKIICISESTQEDLGRVLGKSYIEKSVVIHNGVSTCFRELEGVVKENICLFVGARHSYKGFEHAVKVVNELEDYHFVIVGGGDLTKKEIKLLSRLKNGYVKHGYVDEEQLNVIYNKSMFLLYLSEYEGFGIPLIEASRCACIPVALKSSCIPEVLGASGVIFELGIDPHSIADFLRSRSSEDIHTLRRDVVKNSSRFSWADCVQKVELVYKDIIGR